MKAKIFHRFMADAEELENSINEFLSGFATIEKISFTPLNKDDVLCVYEGETWEEHNIRVENEFWASDAMRPNYDQMKDAYQ